MKAASGVTGLSALLTILFVVLKVSGHFPYSLWWVFSPLWIPIVIVVSIAVFVLSYRLLDMYAKHQAFKKKLASVKRSLEQVHCLRCNEQVCEESLRVCVDCKVEGCFKCLKLQNGRCPSCYDKQEVVRRGRLKVQVASQH